MAAALPILTFHSLDDRQSVISFSPQAFRRGISRLRESERRALGLLEAADCLARGVPFPERSFVITFDDGYQSVYREAFPVLQESGLSATVFITVGGQPGDGLPALEGRPMLSWPQIREMHGWGIEIGAHTLTHPDLTALPPDQAEAQICESKKIIEDALSAPVACFAYPFGRYDDRTREIASQHFACACSDRLALATSRSDLFALERVDAYYLRTERTFDLMLSGLFPAYIWSRSIPRRMRRMLQSGW